MSENNNIPKFLFHRDNFKYFILHMAFVPIFDKFAASIFHCCQNYGEISTDLNKEQQRFVSHQGNM